MGSVVLCLGIETSCDETAASIVEDATRVRSDVISTQIDIHRRWGGVVPELASRNHVVAVMPIIDQAISEAGVALTDIDLIAVTSGPGLQGAILVGLQVAKSLALVNKTPLIGVNHLEGHLLAIRLSDHRPEPPFLGLIVSGGHTSLYFVKDYGQYERLATTRDDAAGEAYDKVAKLLGLPYPGGVPIDALAQQGDPRAIKFPRALRGDDLLEWSFSGLKTAVLHHVKKYGIPQGQALADLAASFQEAVADILTQKLMLGAKKSGAKSIVLCGGVAANSRLRALAFERVSSANLTLYLPPKRLCTDNGAMIAVAGSITHQKGLRHEGRLNADASWRL